MMQNHFINKKIQFEIDLIKKDFTLINKSDLKNFHILVKKSILAIQKKKKNYFFWEWR